MEKPDILIIEGINTLQLPESGQLVTSDFFDFSIYIDAEEDLIEVVYATLQEDHENEEE